MLGNSLTVERLILDQVVGVRVPVPQPIHTTTRLHTAAGWLYVILRLTCKGAGLIGYLARFPGVRQVAERISPASLIEQFVDALYLMLYDGPPLFVVVRLPPSVQHMTSVGLISASNSYQSQSLLKLSCPNSLGFCPMLEQLKR